MKKCFLELLLSVGIIDVHHISTQIVKWILYLVFESSTIEGWCPVNEHSRSKQRGL
jgi:hypothetical protein